MILNAKFTKFGQLSANEVTRYNIPNYLAFSHWGWFSHFLGDSHMIGVVWSCDGFGQLTWVRLLCALDLDVK